LSKENYVSGVNLDIDTKLSLIEKSCDKLLEFKQQDQNIKKLHGIGTQKNTNKNENAL